MVRIYVDDLRETPNGFIHFYKVDDCVSYIRRMYKQGITNFYLDLDHDSGDADTKDYVEILKDLEAMRYGGRLKNANITCHFHSGNVVGIQNMRAIVEANRSWMKEV